MFIMLFRDYTVTGLNGYPDYTGEDGFELMVENALKTAGLSGRPGRYAPQPDSRRGRRR